MNAVLVKFAIPTFLGDILLHYLLRYEKEAHSQSLDKIYYYYL